MHLYDHSLLVEFNTLIVRLFFCRYLHGNKLTGLIPPELGNMTKLHYLYKFFATTFLVLISDATYSMIFLLSCISIVNCIVSMVLEPLSFHLIASIAI